jgi:hypothetical protein
MRRTIAALQANGALARLNDTALDGRSIKVNLAVARSSSSIPKG